MTLSMTGFSSTLLTLYTAQDIHHKNPLHFTITLKTLNSRFFETNFKMPHALNYLEPSLIKHLKSKLYRGTVQLTVYMSNIGSLNTSIKPNFTTTQGYIDALKELQQAFNLSGSITIDNIIELPNIFDLQDQPIEQELTQALLQAIYNLTDDVITVRKNEGLALQQDLITRIENITTYINELKPRSEKVISQKKKAFLDHMITLKEHAKEVNEAAPSSLVLAHQLDKIDIHEEIIRFENHKSSFLSTLLSNTTQEKGKKLDFILQELFREINTIAAKCSDSEISALTIAIKIELEKSREQAQNIV